MDSSHQHRQSLGGFQMVGAGEHSKTLLKCWNRAEFTCIKHKCKAWGKAHHKTPFGAFAQIIFPKSLISFSFRILLALCSLGTCEKHYQSEQDGCSPAQQDTSMAGSLISSQMGLQVLAVYLFPSCLETFPD